MPDVVCMNLQEAQDTIQETGIFYSRSIDATGAGRRQMWDRNWIVVEQSPPPGNSIGEGEAVLSVVKEDEPSRCDGDYEMALDASPTSIVVSVPAPAIAQPTTTIAVVPTSTLPPTTTLPVPTTTHPAPTAPPTTTTIPLPPPPTVAFLSPSPQCDPNYEGACVPIASDVDCAGGSGNGPEYVRGPVYVIGSDIYDLDGSDNDGVGCES